MSNADLPTSVPLVYLTAPNTNTLALSLEKLRSSIDRLPYDLNAEGWVRGPSALTAAEVNKAEAEKRKREVTERYHRINEKRARRGTETQKRRRSASPGREQEEEEIKLDADGYPIETVPHLPYSASASVSGSSREMRVNKRRRIDRWRHEVESLDADAMRRDEFRGRTQRG
ncbi:MAG: hypothetical protein LQ338_007299 [Usnochroma carphineum]|nr:MAG: hypothetical protein LQ338_007299 [Usnochroma carphineum]